EDGIRDGHVTGVQTCALPILPSSFTPPARKLLTVRTRALPVAAATVPPLTVPPARFHEPGNGAAPRCNMAPALFNVPVRLIVPRSEERRVGKECKCGVRGDDG